MNLITRFASLFLCWTSFVSPGFAQSLPGDGNKDGVVDSRDAIILQQNWHESSDSITVDLPDPFPLRMVRIPAGSFMMGSPDTERGREPDEGPVHTVTIGYDFFLGETEVTQAQWEALMGSNPVTGTGVGDDAPVYDVSWDDCQAFLAALNALDRGTFRLPSEAEWEYACRADSTTRFYFGDSLSCLDDCADCGAGKGIIFIEMRSEYMWYCGNRGVSAQTVRQLFGNRFGLYDMAGNLSEWCQDSFHVDYTGAPNDGSAWESGEEDLRVVRGGSWLSGAGGCRSAARVGRDPGGRDGLIGFRLAWTP